MEPGRRTEDEDEGTRRRRHAGELRQRSVELRALAAEARDRAIAAMDATRTRRLGAGGRERAEFAAEQERCTRELASYITALRDEQEMLREETALQDAWFREQVQAMREQGWTRAELAEIGFSETMLADAGLEAADDAGEAAPARDR